MKTVIKSLLLLAMVALAGCSSTHSRIAGGKITARTFNFISTQEKSLPEYAEKRQPVHDLLQKAITEGLARRHISRVDKGGDITVAYLLITGNNAVTTSINDYFGYGRDAEKLAAMAHGKYTGNKNPNYFEAGTLLIDVIDSKTWKVLHRGYATRPLLQNPTAEAQAAQVSSAVEEILAGAQFN